MREQTTAVARVKSRVRAAARTTDGEIRDAKN
jgi:hypothetical protein